MSVAQRARRAAKRMLRPVLEPFAFRYRRLFSTTQQAADYAAAAHAAVDVLAGQVRADAEVMGEFSRVSRRVIADLEDQIEELRALQARDAGGQGAVDVPFAIGALWDLPRGSTVIVVGACANTLAASLAGLGYSVTAHDNDAYPVSHPNLSVAACPMGDWTGPAAPVDAVVALFAPDRALMDRARTWLGPGGRLVVAASLDEQSAALLDGWRIRERRDFVPRDRVTWTELPSTESWTRPEADAGVALVVATPV